MGAGRGLESRDDLTVQPRALDLFHRAEPTPPPESAAGDGGGGNDPGPTGHPGRRWILLGVLFAAAVLGAYVLAAWAVSGRVPRGTTVSGVAVGGMGRTEAQDQLEAAAARMSSGVPLRIGSHSVTLDVEQAGLRLDLDRTLDSLMGFSLDPAVIWRQVAGGGEQVAVTTGDGNLTAQLNELGAAVSTPAKDASIGFSGVTPIVHSAQAGSKLDVAGATRLIRRYWLAGPRPLVLPITTIEPRITQADAEKALDDVARRAVSAPLRIQVGSRTVTLSAATFAPALSVVTNDEGHLELKVDGPKLRVILLAEGPEIGVVPKDARIELRDGKPVIVPGVAGVTIDPTKLADAVRTALTGTGDRTAQVTTALKDPDFTTEDAQKLGVKERVSTFSTNLTSNRQRTENLRVAARTVNGTLVLPGETFSLNGVLGERTAAKGYNQAPAINGGRLILDTGGGVSQMATTIFNNVFFSGMQDVYHKPHSFYISRYPEGREATVNWPTVDLKWRNDSPYGVLIQAWVTDKVNVSFWSTKVWDITAEKGPRTNYRTPKTVYDDSAGCVSQSANPGFDVAVRRIFSKNGRVVRTETFHTSYIAEDEVICGPKPNATPTTGTD